MNNGPKTTANDDKPIKVNNAETIASSKLSTMEMDVNIQLHNTPGHHDT